MLEIGLVAIILIEAVAVALLVFIILRKLRVFSGRFVPPIAMHETARYGEMVPAASIMGASSWHQREVEEVVRYGLSKLPPDFKMPDEVVVEVVPHDLLNQRVRESGVPAVLFGFSTNNGKRVVLSDLIFTLPAVERNRHILHEIWHIGQLASDYHPGLNKSEYDAWAFAERYKQLT